MRCSNIEDDIKNKTVHAESQQDNSFPADGPRLSYTRQQRIEDKQKADRRIDGIWTPRPHYHLVPLLLRPLVISAPLPPRPRFEKIPSQVGP